MGLPYHTIAKAVVFMGLASAPIMLASGLGFMECPAMLCRAGGGTGPDKIAWAADFTGLAVPQILLAAAFFKMSALLDVFCLQIMPRVALVCVAIMMGAIAFAHQQVPDDIAPPIFIGSWALVAANTWPTPGKKEKGN